MSAAGDPCPRCGRANMLVDGEVRTHRRPSTHHGRLRAVVWVVCGARVTSTTAQNHGPRPIGVA